MIDVPGHERFVRTMVAGASGIDLFLLCVAADDGVMPQTREHLAVLRQLDVRDGVVAITKADIGEPELAAEEVAEHVPGAEVVAVSALRGTGLDELIAALDRVAARLGGRARAEDRALTRLHVDRSFTLRGIGTVVTGTLWAGEIAAGDTVKVLPRGLRARVRSVQVHDVGVERAGAGQRVALNLVGPSWRELGRGDVVAHAGTAIASTYLLDVAASLEHGTAALERGTRIHVHHGTREAPARVVPLEGAALRHGQRAYAQLRLEAPLVAIAGDRLILRRLAPADTIGGGIVIDPRPRKHGPDAGVIERLAALERGDRVEPATGGGPPVEPATGGGPPAEPATGGGPPVEPAPGGGGAVEADPDEPAPLDDGALRLAALLRSDGVRPRADAELAEAAGLAAGEARARLAQLAATGQAVRVARNLHFHPEPLAWLEARVVAICERDGEATIAGVRDELALSRKYAQAVLEHLDAEKVTVRRGDAHALRRHGAGTR